MKVSPRSRLQIRLQNIGFFILFLAVMGMLAWLSTRYTFVSDWTASGRNSLSEASVKLLDTIEGPVTITAVVSGGANSNEVNKYITDLIGRYQRYKQDIRLTFINPDVDPQQVRELGVTAPVELIVRYKNKRESVQAPTEQNLTNAIYRVIRAEQHWIVFLEGHGERSSKGSANHDLNLWSQQLENKGFKIQTLNLGTSPVITDNTTVLVIASPAVNLLPGEVHIINEYLDKGGNLLWMHDPGSLHGLEPIAEHLGIEFHPGTIVDVNAKRFGISDPRFAIVGDYPSHPVTRAFNVVTLFPQAAGIDLQLPKDWKGEAFLLSHASSWSETGKLAGTIKMDPDTDIQGPLNIGVALTRELSDTDVPDETETKNTDDDNQLSRQQRVVVVGDGDFLSNAFLGNAGNLDLGLNIVNWLSHDDSFIAIPAKTAIDTKLELSDVSGAIIGFSFLFVLPAGLFGLGMFIWWRRRNR